jgi:uncharacterized protein
LNKRISSLIILLGILSTAPSFAEESTKLNEKERADLKKDALVMDELAKANKKSGTSLRDLFPNAKPVSTLQYWAGLNSDLARAKMKEAIELGADVNEADESGYTPLHGAAENGIVPNVDLLLKNGANTHLKSNGLTAWELAKKNGHLEVVKMIKSAKR